MAANPQIVTSDVTFTYDGVSQTMRRGTVVDVPNGSALATALSGHIVAMTAQQATPVTSDSISFPGLYNLTGGGNQPYAVAQ